MKSEVSEGEKRKSQNSGGNLCFYTLLVYIVYFLCNF